MKILCRDGEVVLGGFFRFFYLQQFCVNLAMHLAFLNGTDFSTFQISCVICLQELLERPCQWNVKKTFLIISSGNTESQRIGVNNKLLLWVYSQYFQSFLQRCGGA